MILDDIIEHKKSELKRSAQLHTLTEVEKEIKKLSPPRDFYSLMSEGKDLKIISEIKKNWPNFRRNTRTLNQHLIDGLN